MKADIVIDRKARSLARLVRRRCWWRGHNVPPYGGFPDECMECGKLCDPDDTLGVWDHWLFLWRYHRPNWMRPIEYFSKCSTCGKRLNRHTDDCPPF